MKRLVAALIWGAAAGGVITGLLMGVKLYTVVSGSMEPNIKTGAAAMTVPVKTVKIGDIIAFTLPADPKKTILHRVVTLKEKGVYQTKGDNNDSADNWDVNIDRIKGKVLLSIPYLGYLGSFVKTPIGFGIVVELPALIIIFGQLKILKQGIEEEIENRVKKRIGTSMVILILGSCFFNISQVMAIFSDTVAVSGITISTGDSRCKVWLAGSKDKIKIKCKKKDNGWYRWEYQDKKGEFEEETELETSNKNLVTRIKIDESFYQIEQ